MEVSMYDMWGIFLLSLPLGAVIGAAFDVIRIIRLMRVTPNGRLWRVVSCIGDFLFLTLSGLVFSVFVYAVNDGVFRAFMLVGALIGFALYRITVGRLVMFLSDKIISFIKRAIRTTTRAILVPLRFIFGVFKKKILTPLYCSVRGIYFCIYSEISEKIIIKREKKCLEKTVI